ncbi:MAG: hypothetical protein M1839_006244 [Geoglossum umbratile]|nr:MAG: hypothetical protein M1839_006244 [Geoglossum umbratile]
MSSYYLLVTAITAIPLTAAGKTYEIGSKQCRDLINAQAAAGNRGILHNDDTNTPYLKSIKDICGGLPVEYPLDDVNGRIAAWVVPLFVLVGTMYFSPFGPTNTLSVVLHLLADPIMSMWSLLSKLAANRRYIRLCQLAPNLPDGVRRHTAMILSAYEEWSISFLAEKARRDSCTSMTSRRSSYATSHLKTPTVEERETAMATTAATLINHLSDTNTSCDESCARLNACLKAAKDLSDSRANGTWKTVLGTFNYLVAVFIAFMSILRGQFNNRTGHSIAFAMLFSWLITAAFLTSIAGGFVNKRSARTILKRLQEDMDRIGEEAGVLAPQMFCFAEEERNPKSFASMEYCGGNYSYRPYESVHNLEMGILLAASIFPIVLATVIAVTISYTSPTRGIGCRSLQQLLYFALWAISACLTFLLKRTNAGAKLWRYVRIKDLIFFIPLVVFYIAAFYGLLNNPYCWSSCISLGPKAYVMLNQTAEITRLARTVWPGLAFAGLGSQLMLVAGVGWVYRKEALLFRIGDEDHEWIYRS